MSGLQGLILKDNQCSLVLRSSSLSANINGFVASTLARLCYFNQSDHEGEAEFVYNDSETFITDLRATIGQRKVHREVRDLFCDKETERFQRHNKTDLVISIGKIPANASVWLEVDVLGELLTEDTGQALVFKTPEIFTPLSSKFCEKSSTIQAYKFDIKIRSDMPFQLAGCHSPSHAIQVDADADAMNAETVIITLAEEFQYDRQIKVFFYPVKPLDVYTSVESVALHEPDSPPNNASFSSPSVNLGTYSSFYTNQRRKSFEKREIFKAKDQQNILKSDKRTLEQDKDFAASRSSQFFRDSVIATSLVPDLSNYSVCGEYIFMLDRSGSMNGSHICNAKESLVLFLKSLPISSYFNVVCFGSYSCSLFPCCQRYTRDSLEKACAYVNSIRADMGGSELLQPLKAVLEKPHRTGCIRNVFVLTDGDIAQPDAVIKYLKTTYNKARIFTFGIGAKISFNTVCNIARSASGKAYFSEDSSKIQTKVIQCLKEILKPTLCEVKVDWQLPTNWQLLRATHEMPVLVSEKRINLYASVQLPPREQKQSRLRKKRKSIVKEFWFDEELDSCQLGDNVFFEDLQDSGRLSGYWDTDTDISVSDCEQQHNEQPVNDMEYDVESNPVRDEIKRDDEVFRLDKSIDVFDNSKGTGTDQSSGKDLVKNWREVRSIRLYSSDTSTETEDETQTDKNTNIFQPEKHLIRRNNDWSHSHYLANSVTTFRGAKTSDDVTNSLARVTEWIGDNKCLSTKITNDSCQQSNNAICNDIAHHDIMYNDVKIGYIMNNGKQAGEMKSQTKMFANKCESQIDMNYGTRTKKTSKENVIDCDLPDDTLCNQNEIDDDIKDFTEIRDRNDSDRGYVLISGYIGPDIHREKIAICLNTKTSSSISLHQMAAKSFINGMDVSLNNTCNNAGLEREIAELSKESRITSSMTSSVTVDDKGNIIGVFQDFLGSNLRNSPNITKGESNPPAILISCPSVDEESRSPTKRRIGGSTEVDPISDDVKYYRIERLDPEGCDEIIRETRRKRLVERRNIPVEAIHRRKLVNTRLTLLSRKMRNAHKLNVFAGPPFIRLILLQSAEGFWQLTYAFARIIGLPLVQLELAAPFVDSTMIPLAEQDDRLGIDCYYDSLALWATALALVYFRRKWISHEEDWELIAIKATSWLQRQTLPPGFGYVDVMLAAKQALVLLEQKYRSRAKSEPVGLND